MKLKLEKTTAKKLYPESPEWFRKVLTETFGDDCFKKKTFEDIKTFEDACEELEIYPEDVFNANDCSDEVAYKKLKVIAKAINQNWTPDWDNANQQKWWPYFKLSSGFGFSYSGYLCAYSHTCVGSRLCTATSEKALYIAEQFEAEYQEFFLYPE